MLDRDGILRTEDIITESVDVPEWGGTVYVRTMTGAERDAFEASLTAGGGIKLENVRAKLVALTACDRAGVRLFRDDDVEALGRKSSVALTRVFEAAQRLNALAPAGNDEKN